MVIVMVMWAILALFSAIDQIYNAVAGKKL
jgi:hypothetical protein